MVTLRSFFSLLAARGAGLVGARALDEALAADGAEARSALRAEGIVRDAARATSWPCDEEGCAREVREVPRRDGARGGARLLAVCTRAEAACEAVTLDAIDVAQATIGIDALADAVARALRLAPVATAGAARRARRAHEPWRIGRESVGEKRDVYLVSQPRAAAVRGLVAEHGAEGARGARLLVWTRGVLAADRELAARVEVAGRGRVAVDALDEVIGVEDKRLVARPEATRVAEVIELRGTRGASAPEDDAGGGPLLAARPSPKRKKGRARFAVVPARPCAALDGWPPPARWGDVTLFATGDEGTLGVIVRGAPRSRILSCADLRLADAQARPIQAFELLQIVCEGNGHFTTRRFGGGKDNAKRILSELRGAMQAAFGIEEDPFERYSRREKCWKPKFRAVERNPAGRG